MRLTRNIQNHFSKAALSKDISRTKFHMPFSHTTTGNSGKLIPFFMKECVPGDTVQCTTSIIARMQTPLAPVMDTAYLDWYYFFVPNRIIWEGFKEFMGERKTATYLPATNVPTLPQVNFQQSGIRKTSVGNYFGLPLCGGSNDPNFVGSVSALPFRAYMKIWNDWFKSTQLDDDIYFPTNSNTIYPIGSTPGYDELLPVNKFADYFTTCLPSPQYGEAVSLGLLSDIPVYSRTARTPEFQNNKILQLYLNTPGDQVTVNSGYPLMFQGQYNGSVKIGTGKVSSSVGVDTGIVSDGKAFSIANLWADGASATAITVNDLRLAFQIQKYKEAQARGGSRYTELLESIWSVNSPDARLQRSEYIGGDRTLVNMQQIIQTSSSNEGTPQGTATGFSKTSAKGGGFTYACPEHGLVIGVMCIRPTHCYQQGVDRYWKKKDVFDFYNPLLANIGEQPVYTSELYGGAQNDERVFGYQEAWADYRYSRSYVSGEMHSNIDNTLDIYHYADDYDTTPTLSAGWLKEDVSLIDRTLAVKSAVSDQFLIDIYCDLSMIRPMPAYSIPGLIDHH